MASLQAAGPTGPSTGQSASGLFTCVTCHVAFKDPDNQRLHFQTEWHAYNLKRKVAAMKPVTKAEFDSKLEAQQQKDQQEEAKASFSTTCLLCNKQYSSENAFQNHLQSKKHKENELKPPAEPKPKKEKDEQIVPEIASKEEENMTEDEIIERKIATARKLTPEECIFCCKKSESLEDNLEHMTVEHSFFVPDIEYLVDMEGLIRYLGEKISIGNICLYCNGKGKGFHTLEAVQKHMVDKGHCKIFYEGDADLEFSDFYDFSASYPDHEEGQDVDEEDIDSKAPIISEDEHELVLPNGKIVGHRSLNRYYKQKFKTQDTRTSVLVNRLMGQYRALGWHEPTVPKSREQIEMLDARQRQMMEIGVRANRLQRHFRRQVDY